MAYLDLIQFHAFCLTETGSRLTQYARAIETGVREGDVVLDLGTGSGVLALLACRAGASRVYAVESSDAIRLGELVAAKTAFAPRIEFIQSVSSQLTLHDKVAVIVGDIHDTFGLQPGGLASFLDARNRFLQPGGTLIPRAIQLLVAPVEATAFYAREIDIWSGCVQGFDLSPVRPFAVSHVHAGRFNPEHLLAPPAPIASIDLASATTVRVNGTATSTAQRDGLMHGVCGCFVTTLANDVQMRNVPGDSDTTNFAQAFFPLDTPVPVVTGDKVSISIDSYDGQVCRWRVEISRAGHSPFAQFDHSTLDGLLLSPELQKQVLDPRIPLSPNGTDVLTSVFVSEPVSGRLRVHPSVLSRELAGETVLLNLDSGVYYGLDAVGTRAWNLLAEERSLADVCSIMEQEYDVAPERLRTDLATLVQELCEKQLLIKDPGGDFHVGCEWKSPPGS
jgi:protein arginine N-methyltransferase 1